MITISGIFSKTINHQSDLASFKRNYDFSRRKKTKTDKRTPKHSHLDEIYN